MSVVDTVWIPLGAAMVDWLTLNRGWARPQALTKPAVMVAALAWLLVDAPGLPAPVGFFFAGLLFSLAGDVLLLPDVDRFKPAVAAFLLAHLAYIAGLNDGFPPVNFSTFLMAGVVALLAVRVAGRLAAQPLSSDLRRWLLAYAGVLAVILFSGLATLARNSWSPAAAVAAATGAVLFALSDIVLVWNRFVAEIPRARLKTRVAYHLGQILMAAGAVLYIGVL